MNWSIVFLTEAETDLKNLDGSTRALVLKGKARPTLPDY